jgi:hypothetical protein
MLVVMGEIKQGEGDGACIKGVVASFWQVFWEVSQKIKNQRQFIVRTLAFFWVQFTTSEVFKWEDVMICFLKDNSKAKCSKPWPERDKLEGLRKKMSVVVEWLQLC